jgi:hypothetical protein
MSRKMTNEIAAELGRKGGKATGYCKIRGGPRYYRAIAKKPRKKRAPAPQISTQPIPPAPTSDESPGIIIIKRAQDPPPKVIHAQPGAFTVAETPAQGPPAPPKINPALRAFVKQGGTAP